LDGDEGLGHTEGGGEKDTDDLSDVGRDEIAYELLHVVVDGASFLNRGHYRREVVVCQDHLGGRLGDCRTRTHRDADFGFLEGRCVVHTVTSLNEQNNNKNKAMKSCL